MAVFIKNIVRWQQCFIMDAQDFPVGEEKSRVVQFFAPVALINPRSANNSGNPVAVLCNYCNRFFCLLNKFFFFEKIVRIIPGNRQFGKNNQLRAFVPGSFNMTDNFRSIPIEIANGII